MSSLTKRRRFRIFKRDNFTCQYCGRKAPEAVLEIDHINPRSNGGTNAIANLRTSCFDCNRGKADEVLKKPSSPYPDYDLDVAIRAIEHYWQMVMETERIPDRIIIIGWLSRAEPAEIAESIDRISLERQLKAQGIW